MTLTTATEESTNAPVDRSKYTPGYIPMSALKREVFDHQRPVASMERRDALREYLYLQAEYGDEKDPVRGNTLGRQTHIHARIEALEKFILTGGCAYCLGQSTALS